MFKPKNKVKEKDGTSTDTKPSKPKKVKIHDIWEACEHGSAEAMEKLLKKKNGSAQISLVNQDGRSPIHIAASAGHVALVQLLLDNGAQCNMIENTEQRWNVLQHAVNSRNFAMMKLIAEQPTLKRTSSTRFPQTSATCSPTLVANLALIQLTSEALLLAPRVWTATRLFTSLRVCSRLIPKMSSSSSLRYVEERLVELVFHVRIFRGRLQVPKGFSTRPKCPELIHRSDMNWN